MSLLRKLHRIISRHAKDVVWVEGVWVEGVDEPVVFVGSEIFCFFACDPFYVFVGEAVSVEVGSQQSGITFDLDDHVLVVYVDNFSAHVAFHVGPASFKGDDFAYGVIGTDDEPFAFVLAIFIYCEQRVFRVDLAIFVIHCM